MINKVEFLLKRSMADLIEEINQFIKDENNTPQPRSITSIQIVTENEMFYAVISLSFSLS